MEKACEGVRRREQREKACEKEAKACEGVRRRETACESVRQHEKA